MGNIADVHFGSIQHTNITGALHRVQRCVLEQNSEKLQQKNGGQGEHEFPCYSTDQFFPGLRRSTCLNIVSINIGYTMKPRGLDNPRKPDLYPT